MKVSSPRFSLTFGNPHTILARLVFLPRATCLRRIEASPRRPRAPFVDVTVSGVWGSGITMATDMDNDHTVSAVDDRNTSGEALYKRCRLPRDFTFYLYATISGGTAATDDAIYTIDTA